MTTLLNTSQISLLSSLCHDAEIISVTTTWSSDTGITLILRIEINPEEDRGQLISMGITSSLIDVVFSDIDRSIIDINGMYDSREYILEWFDVPLSELADEIKKIYSLNRTITHYRILTSAGSSFDLLCTDIYICSVD